METVPLTVTDKKLGEDLQFLIRPNTSDEKSIREVITRRNYGRHGFWPSSGEKWIDLGCNVGAFSVWCAAQSSDIKVTAYEPDPEMCELIATNVKLNGLDKQVEVVQAAVLADTGGKRTGVLHCNTARGNVWRNSMERSWRGGEDITVPIKSIESVLKKSKGAYLKMDIEGSEMAILEWMMNNDVVVPGMVFEWSFDVDPSLGRFATIVEWLMSKYVTVKGGQVPPGDTWKQEWFPPCRLVWALNYEV